MESYINLKGKKLSNDDVFPSVEIKKFSDVAGMPTRKGYDNIIISNGEIVNVCSDNYGLLPNDKYFLKVEEKLIEADIYYSTNSINRGNRSFAVDYILEDERYIIKTANGKDIIKPKLRFVNSYDGTGKTFGSFGYFRQVCTNGLHIAETMLKFEVKHRGNIAELVLPEIDRLIEAFISNEYYSLERKIDQLSSKSINDVNSFVKKVCEKTDIFRFDKSDKNPDPSKYADMVINSIFSEANHLSVEPNFWLGYNAFNEILFDGTFNKTFEKQHQLDAQVFESVMAMAN